MKDQVEYLLRQARRISEASPTASIAGVLFNAQVGHMASGHVYGHRSVKDGMLIQTSEIIGAYVVNGFRVIETRSGSNYLLARPASGATFRDQWGTLRRHLAESEGCFSNLPRSDLSTFGAVFVGGDRVAASRCRDAAAARAPQ